MNNFFEQLQKLKHLVSLSRERKEKMRDALLHIVDADIVARENQKVRVFSHLRHTIQRSFTHISFRPMSIIAMIAIVVLTGGGVGFAAEAALPGDVLYPVKVEVSEEVRSTLTLSLESRADWEARRAERRLEEAEALRAKGELSESQETQIETSFASNAEVARKRIVGLEASGNIEAAATVASRLEGALEAHEQVLLSFNGGLPKPVQVVARVNKVKNELALLRVSLESRIDGEDGEPEGESVIALKAVPQISIEAKESVETKANSTAEGKLKAATNVVLSAERHLERNKGDLDGEAFAAAEARLSLAKETIEAGETSAAKGKYRNAFILGNQAIRIVQESRTLVNAKSKWHVKIPLGTYQAATGTTVDTTTTIESHIEFLGPPVRENPTSTSSATASGTVEGGIKLRIGL